MGQFLNMGSILDHDAFDSNFKSAPGNGFLNDDGINDEFKDVDQTSQKA